jgi:hypothetical protein
MFCHSALGANEAIEHFPVGRRLAFDAAKGRLWAVCRSCERWNLSPLDERWEAIEECERLFRDTKLRVSTDNIGLARLREGTTLVRVGDPQRPEMAAWRYGDQFHRRRTKYYVMIAGGAVALTGVAIGGVMAGAVSFGGLNGLWQLWRLPQHRTIVRLPVNGKVLRISQAMVDATTMLPDRDGGFVLRVAHKPLSSKWIRDSERRVVLSGDEALRAARHLLPRINRAGGSEADVTEAVRVLEASPGADALFGRFAKIAGADRNDPESLSSLRAPVRLALEMSLHEQDERRALEGELSILEDRWREAEEVAAISDDMFVPTGVSAMLKRLKGDRE